ncbi:MAG: phenylacetate--CoA ligase family protein [Planctomycetaceae bacterium]
MPREPRPASSAARDALAARKLDRFRRLLGEMLPRNSFYAAKLARVADPQGIRSLADLGDWPFTFKEELVGAIAAGRPGNLTWPIERYVRYHQTSGTHGRPLPVFDTAADWQWWMEPWRIVLDRGGVERSDTVLVASSFGPYAGFWSGFDAAVARGALTIPTGGLTSLARLEAIAERRATVLLATPSYALHLAEVGRETKIDTTALGIRLVIVAGEPGGSVPATRRRIAAAWNADVLDHAGATEVGPWGVGDLHGDGIDVIEEFFHPEFLSLASGGPAEPGESAELVLTTLGRCGAPVIRYRTGDVVRPTWATAADVEAGACPWVRLDGGIVGRTDDMLVIRGVNVFPQAIDEIVRGFPEVVEHRLTAATRESLDELMLEIEDHLDDPDRVARELKVRLGLRVDVRTVPPGALPRFEGKGRRFVDHRTKPEETA